MKMKTFFNICVILIIALTATAQRREFKWAKVMKDDTANGIAGWNALGEPAIILPSNGLTGLKLGGDITEATTFSQNGTFATIFESSGAVGTGSLRITIGGAFGGDYTIRSYDADDFTGVSSFLNFSESQLSIESDVPTFNGLQYAADYSANFSARSLVDKAYVDGVAGGGIGGSTGSVDNAILRANGTGGSLLQTSAWIIDDLGKKSITTSNTRYEMFPITAHSGVTSGQSTAFAVSDLADGESATIFFIYTGKDDDANTGVGGQFTSTWTKASGTMQKVADVHTVNNNDIGGTLTVSTNESGGSINILVSLVSATGNFSFSGFCQVIYRKST